MTGLRSTTAQAGAARPSVTAMVTSTCAGTHSGFLLRDRTEGRGTAYWQLYAAREHATVANRPQLVLSWG